MKKARSIALNYAFVALIVSVVIALSLWFCEKSLTGQGYEYQFLNFVKIKIPKIGIHFLPFLATLFIFQWVYLKQFFVLNKNEVFRGLQMVGLLGIFLSVMIAILGVQIVIWYFLVLYIFSLAVINLLVAFTSEEAIPPFFVTGFVSVTFLAAVCTFLATLVYSSLGVVEAFGYALNIFILLIIISLTFSAILPILVAIVERLVLIIKVPEVVGVSRPAAVDATEEAS
jgi:hypothetical protein